MSHPNDLSRVTEAAARVTPCACSAQRDRADRAEREAAALAAWKAEALPVMRGLQELGRALGVPLGKSITGPVAVAAAEALRARLAEAEAESERLQAIDDDLSRQLHEDGGWIERATNAEIARLRVEADEDRGVWSGRVYDQQKRTERAERRAEAAERQVQAVPEERAEYICRHGEKASENGHWCDDMGDQGIRPGQTGHRFRRRSPWGPLIVTDLLDPAPDATATQDQAPDMSKAAHPGHQFVESTEYGGARYRRHTCVVCGAESVVHLPDSPCPGRHDVRAQTDKEELP